MTERVLFVGQIIEVDHPFIRETVSLFDGEGHSETLSWRPGVRFSPTGPDGECDAFADGVGKQVFRIVSIHKPGRYPELVFYVRTWKEPSGKEFGKTLLRMTGTATLRRWLKGYRYRFELEPSLPEALREAS